MQTLNNRFVKVGANLNQKLSKLSCLSLSRKLKSKDSIYLDVEFDQKCYEKHIYAIVLKPWFETSPGMSACASES